MNDPTFHKEALTEAQLDIAVLRSEWNNLRREVDDLKSAVGKLTEALNSVNLTLSEARGGWKFMMLLGGAGATFGGFLSWALTHLSVKGTP